MTTVDDILFELADMQPLLATQSALSNGNKTAMLKELAQKITQLKDFDLTAATSFGSALQSSSMSGAHVEILKAALNARMGGPAAHNRKKKAAPQQLLTNNLAYMSHMDWVDLDKPDITPESVIATIAKRYGKCGVRHLDEQTCKPAGATTLFIYLRQHKQWPLYHCIFHWVNLFKQQVALGSDVPWSHKIIKEYPDNPRDLPKRLFEEAYPDHDPPTTRVFPGYQQLLEHIPLRKASNLLRNEIRRLGYEPVCCVKWICPSCFDATDACFLSADDCSSSSPSARIRRPGPCYP